MSCFVMVSPFRPYPFRSSRRAAALNAANIADAGAAGPCFARNAREAEGRRPGGRGPVNWGVTDSGRAETLSTDRCPLTTGHRPPAAGHSRDVSCFVMVSPFRPFPFSPPPR